MRMAIRCGTYCLSVAEMDLLMAQLSGTLAREMERSVKPVLKEKHCVSNQYKAQNECMHHQVGERRGLTRHCRFELHLHLVSR